MRLTYNLRPDPSISLLLANKIWDGNTSSGNIANVFSGQIKYVFVTNHGSSTGPCANYYCGVSQASGETISLQTYLAGEPFPLQTTIKRMNGLQGPFNNSGDILIVLRSEGNTPGSPPGYYFSDGDGTITVHGSISTYESNIIFGMFYPHNNSAIRSRIPGFLDEFVPPLPDTGERLTTQLPELFIKSVVKPRKIFMEQ